MKKWVKISLISIASLVGVILLTAVIAVSLVLSPKQLTKIVNHEAARFVTCDFSLQKADLTFFKTFPNVGVDIHNLTLQNKFHGAPSDTLLNVEQCIAAINIRELLKNKNIIVKKLILEDGNANLFVNEQGKTNFDVFKLNAEDTSTAEFDYALDLKKAKIQNVNVNYLDLKSLLSANVRKMNLDVKGKWQDKSVDGNVKLKTDKLNFETLDSSAVQIGYEQLQFHYDGALKDLDRLEGALKLQVGNANLAMGEDKYLEGTDLRLNTDLIARLSNQVLTLKTTDLKLDDYALQLQGNAQRNAKSGDVKLDVQYKTERWPLKAFLDWLPRAVMGDVLDGMDVDGKVLLDGTVRGHLNEQQLPLITANIDLKNGSFAMDSVPLTFQKINTGSTLNLNLNDQSDLVIRQLTAYTGRNQLTAKGIIRDLLGQMLFDLDVTGDLQLTDFKQLLPESITALSGEAKATVNVKCDLAQLSDVALDQMVASGNFQFKDLHLLYDDSLSLTSPSMKVDVRFPVSVQPYGIGEWAEAIIDAPQLKAGKLGLADLNATNVKLDAFVNNLMDSTLQFMLGTTFAFDNLAGKMDTMDVKLAYPQGTFVMRGTNDMSLEYLGQSLLANLGAGNTVRSGRLELSATTDYKANEKQLLLQWNPSAKIKMSGGEYVSAALPYPVEINDLQADVNVKKLQLKKCKARFGDSDLTLEGTISNIDGFLNDEKLLKGDLELVSNYIDINQIMDVVNGYGNADSVMAEQTEKDADPFMVPKNVDVNLRTTVKKALFEDAQIRNLGGNVSVKDGVLVLDQMGLTSDAARIQLTALYKSPRRNHLFLGLDFHLLDVKIAELIDMIPEVDTVLPMLKNFAGNAEFHFAINTNLNSKYELKYSTLRGAAAISGKDLVVLDNETYDKISKLLMFNKKTVNKIDSLSAEMTIFKNEVDVYPFAVSIDKYQAILSGRHNLDMTYDYNVTVAKPVRLGIEIEGKDKLKIKLAKPKYAKLYNPKKQGVLEENTMMLKNQIRQALEANVKPQEVN